MTLIPYGFSVKESISALNNYVGEIVRGEKREGRGRKVTENASGA